MDGDVAFGGIEFAVRCAIITVCLEYLDVVLTAIGHVVARKGKRIHSPLLACFL